MDFGYVQFAMKMKKMHLIFLLLFFFIFIFFHFDGNTFSVLNFQISHFFSVFIFHHFFIVFFL